MAKDKDADKSTEAAATTKDKSSKPKPRFLAPTRRKKLRVLVKVFAFLVIIAAIVFAIVSSATSGVVKVSDQFLADLRANNPTSAYQLFSAAAKANVPEDQFPDALTALNSVLTGKPKNTGKSVSASTTGISTAVVTYEIKNDDNKLFNITFSLVKEDGEWKINNFNSTPVDNQDRGIEMKLDTDQSAPADTNQTTPATN